MLSILCVLCIPYYYANCAHILYAHIFSTQIHLYIYIYIYPRIKPPTDSSFNYDHSASQMICKQFRYTRQMEQPSSMHRVPTVAPTCVTPANQIIVSLLAFRSMTAMVMRAYVNRPVMATHATVCGDKRWRWRWLTQLEQNTGRARKS